MTTTDEQYTPDDEDIFIAYRFMSLGLMRDPDDKPHDPVATAEADAEYRRWLAAHDARVRRDAALSTYAAAYRTGWLDGQNGSPPDPRMAYPEETP